MLTNRCPLLLLDVDGVLNPFAAETCPDGYDELDLFPDDDLPVRLNREHGRWLLELAEHLELVWATGWGADANRVLSPLLGFPSLRTIEFPPVPFAPREKVPAIAAFTEGRAVAWIDDVMTPEAHAWADSRRTPTLLVDVDPVHGLTRSIIDHVSQWWSGLLPGQNWVREQD